MLRRPAAEGGKLEGGGGVWRRMREWWKILPRGDGGDEGYLNTGVVVHGRNSRR